MRKSTAITMAIILIAMAGMMVAADIALKPMQHVLTVGKDLTSVLEARADIKQGSKVKTVARKPKESNLAKVGWGMIIELEPSEGVTKRKGRLTKLAFRAASEGRRLYAQGQGRRLEWIEIKMVLAQGVEKRALLSLDREGRLGSPEPALPAKFP